MPKIKFLRSLALLALLGGLSAVPASAQQDARQQDARLSLQEQTDLKRIEDYLNSITTLRARFTQVGENGGFAEGNFYLSRPGRMRIEYDNAPYLYVADGFWLTFYDAELGQRSDVLLGTTLADFITRDDISLSGDVRVIDLRRQEGTVEVDLVQADDPGAGRLTLVFQDRPLMLQRWTVVDAQGATTEIYLSNIQSGGQLDSGLFVAPRPPKG